MKHAILKLAVLKAAWTAVVVSAAAGAAVYGAVAVAAATGIHLVISDKAAASCATHHRIPG